MLGWLKKLFGGGRDEAGTSYVTNPQLTAAIKRLAESPSDANREYLHQEFLKSSLWVAVQQMPPRLESRSPQVLQQDELLGFRTTANAEGNEALLTFTDLDALQARIKNGAASEGGAVLRAQDLLAFVHANDFDGIIIQSAEGWAELSRAEVERLFEKATS